MKPSSKRRLVWFAAALRLRFFLHAVLLCGLATACVAASPSEDRIPMTTPAGRALTLQAKVHEPESPGRHPAVIINHGSPRDPARRRAMAPGYEHAARW